MDKCPTKDGGPIASSVEVYAKDNGTAMFPKGGLTIRDWFAGMALTSLCSDALASAAATGRKDPNVAVAELAKASYAIADAMLVARKSFPNTTNP